ncbi:hypothetical protein ACJ3XI_00095 [Litorimonas sp. RW-G-Af-16]|uniref:hypothetical protein n=1 Tax=Litorimonas sp. RW-G-Af-16 TaxID=3241168 RepID=UPI00390C4354
MALDLESIRRQQRDARLQDAATTPKGKVVKLKAKPKAKRAKAAAPQPQPISAPVSVPDPIPAPHTAQSYQPEAYTAVAEPAAIPKAAAHQKHMSAKPKSPILAFLAGIAVGVVGTIGLTILAGNVLEKNLETQFDDLQAELDAFETIEDVQPVPTSNAANE